MDGMSQNIFAMPFEVTVAGNFVIRGTCNPFHLTPEKELQLKNLSGASDEQAILALMDLYAGIIVSWDFAPNGQVIEPTAENLFKVVPSSITDTVIKACQRVIDPNLTETPEESGVSS